MVLRPPSQTVSLGKVLWIHMQGFWNLSSHILLEAENSCPFSMLSTFIFVSLKIAKACMKTAAAEITTCMKLQVVKRSWEERKSGEGFVKLAEGWWFEWEQHLCSVSFGNVGSVHIVPGLLDAVHSFHLSFHCPWPSAVGMSVLVGSCSVAYQASYRLDLV